MQWIMHKHLNAETWRIKYSLLLHLKLKFKHCLCIEMVDTLKSLSFVLQHEKN